MGILNVTPDSFSDGGAWVDPERALEHALRMEEEGADVVDIGAESTRPGAMPVPLEEEWRRLRPVLDRLGGRLGIPFSVDTYKAEIARRAIALGARMINCVGALSLDSAMADVVAGSGASIVLMHMRGTPQTMQENPLYRDVVAEVCDELAAAVHRAEEHGIARERILVDPGLGFGKTFEHNLLLLRHVDTLATLGCPVLIGPSRKSFVARVLGSETGDRDDGTMALVAWAALRGIHMVRVHDVRRTRNVIRILEAVRRVAH
ncbi:MAG: dihydropteroate synthase [Nitrospirae bacterium]|nr:dihydropteroate synthase [Nitrospirota bacterium]